MFKASLFRASLLVLLAVVAVGGLRAQSTANDLANMRQDIDLLRERVGQLEVTVDALQRANNDLSTKAAGASQSYATVAQLNDAIADMNRTIKSATASNKAETLQQVSVQMDKLVAQTNAALDQMAKNVNASRSTSSNPVNASPTFSDNYPQQGVEYVVQRGDTIGAIAKKTGAKQQDIINANKIADPSKLFVGQKLFIPVAK